jgi:hypothetical protein
MFEVSAVWGWGSHLHVVPAELLRPAACTCLYSCTTSVHNTHKHMVFLVLVGQVQVLHRGQALGQNQKTTLQACLHMCHMCTSACLQATLWSSAATGSAAMEPKQRQINGLTKACWAQASLATIYIIHRQDALAHTLQYKPLVLAQSCVQRIGQTTMVPSAVRSAVQRTAPANESRPW